MLILTEPTPNPDALKLIAEAPLTAGAAYAFQRQGFDPAASALADGLFGVEGVERVFVAREFVTVTRGVGAPPWSALKPEIIHALAEHLATGAPAVAETHELAADPVHDEIEAEIRQVLADYVKPGVSRDGGEVLFERFDDETGVLWIAMQGACGGCPSSRLTLKAGVETIVRRYVPEVVRVEEAVATGPAQDAQPSRLRQWIGGFRGAGGGQRPIFTHGGRQTAGGGSGG